METDGPDRNAADACLEQVVAPTGLKRVTLRMNGAGDRYPCANLSGLELKRGRVTLHDVVGVDAISDSGERVRVIGRAHGGKAGPRQVYFRHRWATDALGLPKHKKHGGERIAVTFDIATVGVNAPADVAIASEKPPKRQAKRRAKAEPPATEGGGHNA